MKVLAKPAALPLVPGITHFIARRYMVFKFSGCLLALVVSPFSVSVLNPE